MFTTTRDTPIEDVDVWWLGYEMLSIADRELHQADMILRETDRLPFAANAVAGADDPARFARYFPTSGWKPIATRIQVNDVAGLVRNLGGRALYGDNAHIPLRELIQNARDAIVARRIKENRDESWGAITVRLLSIGDKQKVEVHDTGLGMSEELLAGPFLDFGTSYWNSALMLREHPGLTARGFQPQGRFGIGFFSVFMWGEHIKVVTRRPEEGVDATRVLEFRKGLSARPVLRQADTQERMIDPGTVVHIWLDTRATDAGGLLAPGPIQWIFHRREREKAWSLNDLCMWLCPALDVNLHVVQDGKFEQVIVASDWETIDAGDLLRRLILHRDDADSVCASALFATLSANLRPMIDGNGRLLGRAAFKWFMDSRDFANEPLNHASLITAGSFRASDQMDMVGVLLGHPENASRFPARPIAFECPGVLARWATEQADLVPSLSRDLFAIAHYALLVRLAGGDTRDLPIARRSTGLCSFNDIANSRDLPDEIELSVDN
ncbi:MAG: ATP-binding protein [Isosphaeraceae bacterium]